MRRQTNYSCDRGSITAELAISLPAVFLVLLITLSAFSLQVERMKLVDVASTAARAIARGEDEAKILALVEQLAPSSLGTRVEFDAQAEVVCATLSRTVAMPGLGTELFELAERQCARKAGL